MKNTFFFLLFCFISQFVMAQGFVDDSRPKKKKKKTEKSINFNTSGTISSSNNTSWYGNSSSSVSSNNNSSRSNYGNSYSSVSSSSNSSRNNSYSDFMVLSAYDIGRGTLILEKKTSNTDYRVNGDGTRFYRTTLALGIKEGVKYERTILQTDLYTQKGYVKAAQPCVLIDPNKSVLYIFSISKASDRQYGMNGYIYRMDMKTGSWSREIVFTDANFGWYSFFGGSNNGNPELWHFSYAGYFAIRSVRNNGRWGLENRGRISPSDAESQYRYHENILITSSPGVDRMTGTYMPRQVRSYTTSNSSPLRLSDRTIRAGIGIIGTAAFAYGVFKLLTGHLSDTPYYSGGSSYSSSSSSYSSNSSSSNRNSSSSSSSSQSQNTVDIESISLPNYQWDSNWYVESILPSDIKNTGGENQSRKIKFPGVRETGKITHVVDYKGYWAGNCRYETLNDAITAEYVRLKYGKIREKGRMHGIFY